MTKEQARQRRAASLRGARQMFQRAARESSLTMREWLEDRAFNFLEKARRFKALEKGIPMSNMRDFDKLMFGGK